MRLLTAASALLVLLAGAILPPLPARAAWVANGVPVTTTGLNYQPTLIPDGAGGSIIAWHGGATTDVYAQRLQATGDVAPGWPLGVPLLVCNAVGLQEYPVLVSDMAQGAILVWQDSRNGSNYDIYAQRILSNGTWIPNWVANGRVISSAAGDQFAPVATSDNAGGAIIAWYDSRNGAANYDIYAQRVTAAGDVGPASWPPAGFRVCGAIHNQIDPVIAADGAGGAFIAWQDYRKDTEYDIYLQHMTGSGLVSPGWPADGLAVCTIANSQFSPVLAADGAGGVFVAWQDYRNGADNDIYAQHVSAGGSPTGGDWDAGGRPACLAPNSQYFPAIASASGTDAVIAWQDLRSGVDYDVEAQHLALGGDRMPGWREDGNPVSLALNGQFAPRVTADGASGAFVTWHDTRNGTNDDVYMHQFSGDGVMNPLWPADGYAECVAGNSQLFPVVVSGAPGQALVVWQDERSGELTANAIYAQQSSTSDVAGLPAEHARVSFVGPGGPNPFRSMIRLRLTLVAATTVEAQVFDVAGRRVRTLESRTLEPGTHEIAWDGAASTGAPVAPGVYLVRVRWPGYQKTQRVVRLQ